MHSKAAPRRRHGAELKTQVLAECDGPAASVAAVAQSHGLNANLVHKWRRQQRARLLEATAADAICARSRLTAIQNPGNTGELKKSDVAPPRQPARDRALNVA